jgi:drug/metabolite transporter (DMT)-like permease
MTGGAARLAAERPADDIPRAIGFMCLSIALFPVLNASAKYLGPHYPMPEILWARYFGHFVYMLILFMPRRGWRLFRTRRLGMQLLRSMLLLGSTASFFLGLKGVSLAMASSINFIGPFIVTALSVPMLGERVGPRRWAAVLIGFAGALIIIRPGGGTVSAWALFIVANATFYAFYQIYSRLLASVDPAETTITYASMVGTVAASLALPFAWRLPDSALDWCAFFGLGLFGGLGHYFVVKAFESAPASVLSPFNYLQLIGATVVGYAFFGDFPDTWTWIGAAVIVASGLYITYRETKLKQAGVLA